MNIGIQSATEYGPYFESNDYSAPTDKKLRKPRAGLSQLAALRPLKCCSNLRLTYMVVHQALSQARRTSPVVMTHPKLSLTTFSVASWASLLHPAVASSTKTTSKSRTNASLKVVSTHTSVATPVKIKVRISHILNRYSK